MGLRQSRQCQAVRVWLGPKARQLSVRISSPLSISLSFKITQLTQRPNKFFVDKYSTGVRRIFPGREGERPEGKASQTYFSGPTFDAK